MRSRRTSRTATGGGHGPAFARECTRIGEALGLPPVGVKGRGGLPDCAHWPMCVGPEGYYPLPYKKPSRRTPTVADHGDAPTDQPDDGALDTIRALLKRLDAEALRQLQNEIAGALATA